MKVNILIILLTLKIPINFDPCILTNLLVRWDNPINEQNSMLLV